MYEILKKNHIKQTIVKLLSENKQTDIFMCNGKLIKMSSELKNILYSGVNMHPKIKSGVSRGFLINLIDRTYAEVEDIKWEYLKHIKVKQIFMDSKGNEFQLSGLESYIGVFFDGLPTSGNLFENF